MRPAQPHAAGGVLAVHHHEVERPLAPEPRQVLGDRRPAAPAHHVAEEEEFHGASHSREPPLVARIGPRPVPHGHSSRRTKVRRQLPPFPLWLAGHAPPKARTVTQLAPWRDQSLVVRFLTAGGAVMLAAMLVIGSWITARIEDSVVANAASVGALYLDSFVSPLSQELAASDRLSEPAGRALAEVFGASGMGERIVSFRDLEAGRPRRPRLEPRHHRRALRPDARARGGPARRGQRQLRGPRRRRRTPPRRRSACRSSRSTRRSTRSGRAGSSPSPSSTRSPPTLERDLANARRDQLAARRRRLPRQRPHAPRHRPRRRPHHRAAAGMLEAQVAESRSIAAQNVELRRRAVGASARAAAQAERSLRRVSADLHDGPAQYVALAAMRLDSLVPDTEAGRAEAETLRRGLQTALAEIRAISRGLSLPELDGLPLAEVAPPRRGGAPAPAGVPGRLRLHGPGGPRGRRLAPDLPLPLPAGGAVERHPPCARRRGARRRRGRRRTA